MARISFAPIAENTCGKTWTRGTACPGPDPFELTEQVNLFPDPGPGSPLLVYNDISTQKNKNDDNADSVPYCALTKQQKQGKRLFSTLQSGLAWNCSKPMRFMTLTSSNDSPSDTLRSFNRLITVIRRTTPTTLYKGGYMTLEAIADKYCDKGVDEPLNIEYMAVLTNEGNGVIHSLIVGDYIPQKWLSDTWKHIHKAWNVDIRMPRGRNGNVKIARYILAQYVKGQNSIKRINCSRNWIYPGWRDDLKKMIADSKKECKDDKLGFQVGIQNWTNLMLKHKMPSHRYPCKSFFPGWDDLDLPVVEYSRKNYQEWMLNDDVSRR